jgi:hypothetical protein
MPSIQMANELGRGVVRPWRHQLWGVDFATPEGINNNVIRTHIKTTRLKLRRSADGVVVGRLFKANAAPVREPWMWPLDAAPLIRIHGQHPTEALRPGSVGAVTLKAFACSRALAFYRPSICWSKLVLSVGGRSGDAVWLRRLLRRSEPLGAHPFLHLYYDAPRSEQTRSRPSTASIEAPLHSASATQIGPLETTTQKRGLAFASPMGVRTRSTTLATSGSRLSTHI